MKKIHSLLFIAAASLLILATGCSQQRVVWSPDGNKAAILSDDGLYLSDANGKLSGLLVSNTVMAEWFSDSRRLALIRKLKFENWAELQPHLRAENREFVQKSQITQNTFNGHEGQENIDLYELYVGTIGNNQITLGPALIQTQQQPQPLGIRVSPTQTAIALVTDVGQRDESRLWIVAADGSAAAKIVSDDAATHPDWTKDGRSLVYINATGEKKGSDDLLLGSLVRRQVLNAAGAVEIQTAHEDLAGMLFASFLGVRCFDDGRILFVALDVQLPATTDDMPGRPQIFAWDPRHKATLTRMIPRNALDQTPDINFFDISPDEKSLLISGEKGAVKVLSLAEGKLTEIEGAGDNDAPSLPSWRGDEVCYMTPSPTNSANHKWDVALWKDGTNRVISANWPAEVLVK
jgi:hypothetical protein